MAFETKKDRSGDGNDVWEALLTRRLANELDAFLEKTDDETFLFVDETNSPRRINERGQRSRFKTWATVAASAVVFCCVASTARFYLAPLKTENIVAPRSFADETSLFAWSVENLSETSWARHVETKWANADFFELASATEKEEPERLEDVDVEADAAESAPNSWFNAETLIGVAESEPLKYEPFLQIVAASLR